jgi:uncharacterized protein
MGEPTRLSVPARTLLRAIRGYQLLFAHRASPCRYIPGCSEYAREAIEVHGAAGGGWLAVRRLARCHPFGGFGFDPVPSASVSSRHHEHGATPC